MTRMQITLNGRPMEIEGPHNLKDLIRQFSPAKVVAEMNGRVIKSAEWEQTPVQEGDTVELVRLVGGG